ncbi:hypothetical protein IF832_25250 [Citrobacter freundii]|uniref:hypothetical protein n=1 Tax=Citrobacter freundii TaxID=546 RepID=UPI00101CCE2A|nr:hypothetical protein [Citrobacter freundii]MBD5622143.1 hypothetical protein [Citrobacter freundii]RYH71137.1 hypothetical protein EVY23_22180 [Citrobacter freundii]
MTLWTQSGGILARSAQISACLNQPLARFIHADAVQSGDVLVGWGQKPNTGFESQWNENVR